MRPAKKNSPRRAAEMAGAMTYDPGFPCKKGHLAPRRTSCGHCTECRREMDRLRYERERQQARCYRAPGYYFKDAP